MNGVNLNLQLGTAESTRYFTIDIGYSGSLITSMSDVRKRIPDLINKLAATIILMWDEGIGTQLSCMTREAGDDPASFFEDLIRCQYDGTFEVQSHFEIHGWTFGGDARNEVTVNVENVAQYMSEPDTSTLLWRVNGVEYSSEDE